MSCISTVLRHLATTPPGCLERANYSSTSTTTAHAHLAHYPVYVLNAPSLTHRRSFMRLQLVKLGAQDVTWVMCSNRPEVDALSPRLRACAYPCVQLNRYSNTNDTTGEPNLLSNGTVSLALKHKLCAYDLLQRGLTSALVLEDDAVLPPQLWRVLHYVARLPLQIELFWMGSYSSRKNVGTLADHAPVTVAPPHAAAAAFGGGAHESHESHAPPLPALAGLRKRNTTRFPPILGTVAYVLTDAAARLVAREPVTTAADIAISYFPREGVTHTIGMPRKPPPPGAQQHRGSGRTYADGTCEAADGTRYTQHSPAEQYGPSEWIIWPVAPQDRPKVFGAGDHGATHGVALSG